MDDEADERIDLPGGLTLAWGDTATWKARFREEAVREFQLLPPEVRLARALEMGYRHPPDEAAPRPEEPASDEPAG